MSRENVDLARRGNDAVARRDLDGFLALADPDVQITARYTQLEGVPFRGHEGVRSWWANIFEVFADFRPEIEEARDLGDSVLATVRLRGRGTSGGAPFEETVWQVTEWRDQKCVSVRTFGSEAEALMAVGLSP